jgi:hypothetical protein
MVVPSVLVHHPSSHLERRVVTNVLIVPASQFRDPIAHIVLVESGYRSLYDLRSSNLVPSLSFNWRARVVNAARHATPPSDDSSVLTSKV